MADDGANGTKGDDAHDHQRLKIRLQRNREQRVNQNHRKQYILAKARGDLATFQLLAAERKRYAREIRILTRSIRVGETSPFRANLLLERWQECLGSNLATIDIASDIDHTFLIFPADRRIAIAVIDIGYRAERDLGAVTQSNSELLQIAE